MNKYHYKALVDLILGCTLIACAGIIYTPDEVVVSYLFSGIGVLKFISYFRNEKKAEREAVS